MYNNKNKINTLIIYVQYDLKLTIQYTEEKIIVFIFFGIDLGRVCFVC